MRLWAKFAKRARLPVGYLTTGLLLALQRGEVKWLVAGTFLFLRGLGLRLWAAGHLRKGRELTTSGPFAHVRHPLYLGTLLIGLGYGTMSGRWWGPLLVAGLFGALYLPTMLDEEQHLKEAFGERYEEYKRNVPMLLPRLRAWERKERSRFSSLLLRRNREHIWALCNLAVAGLFWALGALRAKGERRK